MKSKKGFSLIEILVVVTIIGVLAAGGAVSYTTVSRNARNAKRKADLEQIRAALEMFRSNSVNSTYPVYTGGNCTGLPPSIDPYLPVIPTDPKTASRYYCNVTTTNYTLGAVQEGQTNPCGVSCQSGSCNYTVGPFGQVCP